MKFHMRILNNGHVKETVHGLMVLHTNSNCGLVCKTSIDIRNNMQIFDTRCHIILVDHMQPTDESKHIHKLSDVVFAHFPLQVWTHQEFQKRTAPCRLPKKKMSEFVLAMKARGAVGYLDMFLAGLNDWIIAGKEMP